MTDHTRQRNDARDRQRPEASVPPAVNPLVAGILPDPLLPWVGLANQTGEMMLAAAQVIGHRTGRMAAAGPAPSADDLDEFSLMTHEKFEAAAESSWSVTTQWLQLNQQLWTQMLKQMQSGVSALMSAAASPNMAEALAHHAALVTALAPSPDAHAQFSNAAAELARRALEPIHARATANAVRLGGHEAAATTRSRP